MRVGWLQDDPGYVGGAELTMAEFRSAAPRGVEVVDCPPGGVAKCDVYVVGNCLGYDLGEIEGMVRRSGTVVRYHHDVARAPVDGLFTEVRRFNRVRHAFCSPLQRARMGMEGELIPPALDLDRFRALRSSNHRHGACCVGRMAYGKGLELIAEYPEPVDVYSSVPVRSERSARYRGAAADVPATLAQYEKFVFLPTALEPFGRAVVEAWAAGLDLVVNRNVGALYWIEYDQPALETAAADFWRLVTK